MTSPALLPPRALSPQELAGFRIACACMATFGRQIAADPAFAPRGRFLVLAARALDLTIGQGRGTPARR